MNITEILPGIHYVGVNDRTTTRFEGLWSLPHGVSYNAYLVADEKVALIDTVEEAFGSRLFENIRETIGDRPIDYLVVNHMEPDHSSSIRALRLLYPDIRIVGNAKTLQMIQGFYGIDTGTLEVKEGDTISLGAKTLSFYMAPMVHWPETMVTWCAEAGTLFSGDAFGTFGRNIKKYTVLVTKSTVPVGTAQKVKAVIREELARRKCKVPFDVASNPEFLKEGAAVKDFMSPDRVVVGVESERARKLMTKLYRPFLINNFRVLFMDIPSAEMTKYAANAMLATRISFMNEIANLCDLVGADVEMVRKGIGSDARIGSKFLYPGCGYGGSCFPKDVKALAHTAHEHGYTMQVIEAVERVNERQKSIVFDKLQLALGDLRGKTVAVWGLAFKPETDDIREAPALVVIDRLLEAGATVRAYDPVAANESRRRLGEERVYHAASMYEAAEGADAVALITEWKQFRMPDWTLLRSAMRDNIIVDGRNILDKEEALNAGFRYYGIGK